MANGLNFLEAFLFAAILGVAFGATYFALLTLWDRRRSAPRKKARILWGSDAGGAWQPKVEKEPSPDRKTKVVSHTDAQEWAVEQDAVNPDAKD